MAIRKKCAQDAREPQAGMPALPKNEIALLSAEAASSAISDLPNYRSSS
jgi:hypothetical protein